MRSWYTSVKENGVRNTHITICRFVCRSDESDIRLHTIFVVAARCKLYLRTYINNTVWAISNARRANVRISSYASTDENGFEYR